LAVFRGSLIVTEDHLLNAGIKLLF
jgi:hypothetical protein